MFAQQRTALFELSLFFLVLVVSFGITDDLCAVLSLDSMNSIPKEMWSNVGSVLGRHDHL